MSVIGSNILAGASGQGGGYNLTNSLRFRSSASAYLNRTATTPTDAKKGTLSMWVKRGLLTLATSPNNGDLVGSGDGFAMVQFYDTSLYFGERGSNGYISTAAVFRDPSAWYHVFCVFDTTLATANDRLQIWVNNVRQATGTFNVAPTLNSSFKFLNENSTVYNLGAENSSSSVRNNFDGYLAETNFIDGQALTPSSFGETSTDTGVWIPKKFVGTYGTNGFYLKFTDTTSTSTLGTDFSGNSNTWTVNNISLTAGSTYDSMTDVPTLTSATVANYAVFNPLNKSTVGTATPSNGNLNVLLDRSSNNPWIQSTIAFPSSGKWYLEYSQTSIDTGSTPYNFIGVMDVTTPISTPVSSVTGVRGYYLWDGQKRSGTTATSYGSATALNDIIGVAVDMDSGKIWFAVNNTWVNSGSPTGGTNAAFTDLTGTTWSFFNSILGETSSNSFVNFGQRPFSYTPPTGFVALNTFNLPTPTIGATASTTANKYMDVLTWTGNGASSRAITGLNFQPDWVWDKMRSDSYQHAIVDSVRGGNQVLHSNSTSAEDTNWQYGYVSSFDSNGFTIQAGSTSSENWNLNAATFVAWNWNAGGSTVTNTTGSINSQVRASTTAGFSIVTWTLGSTNNSTIGHGLGVAPSMIIVKNRSAVAQWLVYQSANTSSPATQYLALEATQATTTDSRAWNNTLPTSSVFTIGNAAWWGSSSNNMVAYCFAPIAGYSAFGSYTGNGSTDGPFVYTGFRPKYWLIKRTDSSDFWVTDNSVTSPYNLTSKYLLPNTADAEGDTGSNPAGQAMDVLSNGFKLRNTNSGRNASGGTYIYMAFAENPFKYSLAR